MYDKEDKYHIICTEYKYGDENNGCSNEYNIETFQYDINAAMVKDTPENDSRYMDRDETINGGNKNISGWVCSVGSSSKTTISLYDVRDNDIIQEKH